MGPLFPPDDSTAKVIRRRAIGIPLETLALALVTVLLPVLLIGAVLVDSFLWVKDRKPWVGIRLVAFLWTFLATEFFATLTILFIYLRSGGPFGKGSMARRRGVYWLRPRWARMHLGTISALFGLRFEVEGAEYCKDAPYTIMIRHASIIDNMIPDVMIALPNGVGIRYVVKRELEALPVIDIGGRWITTNFLNRTSDDAAGEIARMGRLAEEMGPAETLLIYPEGTRATAKKIARAKEKIRESAPDVAPLADQMVNLLPPRLGGPLQMIDQGLDVLFCAHVGFDGYEYVSDVWSGRLVGSTIRVKFWRVPAGEIPEGERERTEWLYGEWRKMDEWVGEQKRELGIAGGRKAELADGDGPKVGAGA